MLNKLMNKILGGTVNTTDNQVTAQVKAEPTVAKNATLTAADEGEQKQTRRRTNTRRPAGEGRTRQQTAGEVKVQHANAVLQILAQVRMVAVLIRLAVQIHVAMPNKVKVKNVKLAKLVHRVVKIHVIRVLIMVTMVRTAIITAQITVLQVGIIKRNKWN